MNARQAYFTLVFMFATLVATVALAVPPEIREFEPLLLPMYNGHATGAAGTNWRVEDVLFNSSDRVVRVFPQYAQMQLFPEPVIGEIQPRSRLYTSGLFVKPFPCRGLCEPPPGAIIWIHPSDAHALTTYSRVFELSADHDNYGAVVPAVRASEFRKGRLSLACVRVGENFRATLRIYNMAEASDIVVSLISRSGSVVSKQAYALPGARSADPEYGVATIPGYVQLALSSALIGAGEDTLDVTIEGSSSVFWAFASVTSNSAQRVTIITP